MSRVIYDHKISPYQRTVEVVAVDEQVYGAHHQYEIWAPAVVYYDKAFPGFVQTLSFQKGPVPEHGLNGVTQEALLAIVIDRLRCFQAGSFPCRENAIALTKCEEALMWLNQRTHDREMRNVEGKNQA